ncbi:unnamed protein product [Citrullus colocynthis]|uniref:Uncharacterized protein n=1 Tax=Citrullus colocynthis TaxID=252529 RepID=A0ABP0XYV1_9ROSI
MGSTSTSTRDLSSHNFGKHKAIRIDSFTILIYRRYPSFEISVGQCFVHLLIFHFSFIDLFLFSNARPDSAPALTISPDISDLTYFRSSLAME